MGGVLVPAVARQGRDVLRGDVAVARLDAHLADADPEDLLRSVVVPEVLGVVVATVRAGKEEEEEGGMSCVLPPSSLVKQNSLPYSLVMAVCCECVWGLTSPRRRWV